MHSLRLMTLCLNYFQFILVSDWNKQVQNVPIILIFPELETWQKMMKINCKNGKIPQSFGTLPRTPLAAVSETTRALSGARPHLQGLTRPYNPATGWHLCAFWPMAWWKFPLTEYQRQKEQTIDTLPSGWVVHLLYSTLSGLRSETSFFHLLSKKIRKSSWTTFCRFPLTHILPH